MGHQEFFKISIGIVVALLVGIGVGTAVYFFGKNRSGEMPVVSVQNEGGFPESGERALKPYQYPESKPKSYPQPSSVKPPSQLPTPQIQAAKPFSKNLVVFPKIVYPKDYEPYGDAGEEGYDPDKDSEAETE